MKRLPNNYGSISKLSGARKRPYMIRHHGKVLGYASTYEEALSVLNDYNKNPYNLDMNNATLGDVWGLFSEHKLGKYSEGTIRGYCSAYNKYISALSNRRYADFRLYHFTNFLDGLDCSNNVKNLIIKVLKHLDDTAYAYDIVTHKYTYELDGYKEETKRKRRPFTEDEINTLWDNAGDDTVDRALIMIYTGLRISEFTAVTADSLDGDFIVGGVKTEAGKNRRIPIHPRIRPLVDKFIERDGTLYPHTTSRLREEFRRIMERMGMDHIPHECRHTMRTRLDNAGANKVCIDRIMGHKSGDTGKDIYTHKTDEQLMDAVLLLN